ncbi:MAG: NADH-quinone oxidoreductase subunit NuoE [Clostridiales bacterium]|nr:NADH-quinone oxidoreductase subunit NuoE [Clostridiales bacterium]
MIKSEDTQAPDMDKLKQVLDHYAHAEGSLITILQKAQDIYGYLPLEAIKLISASTGVKPAKVYGVISFYAQFRLSPVGKNLILLCQGTACHVNSSDKIEEAIAEELGISRGDTTPDQLFTLNTVACLGCCSLSPVMMINGQAYGNLTPEKAKKTLREIKGSQSPHS